MRTIKLTEDEVNALLEHLEHAVDFDSVNIQYKLLEAKYWEQEQPQPAFPEKEE